MTAAVKSLMKRKTKQTFLDPFNLTDKATRFEEVLKSFFMKEIDNNMTTFTVGCEKEAAKDYAAKMIEEYARVEISTQLLELSNIQDAGGKTIFQNNEKTFGWFIFIDKNIFANWGHDCRYIFYINEEMFFEEQLLLPPNANFPMEVVE